MTTAALILFEGNEQTGEIEFQNSWLGAAFAWSKIFDAHIPKRDEYDSWLFDSGRLWDWPKQNRADEHAAARAVMFFTFDRFVVREENFARFGDHIDEFCAKYDGINSHWIHWGNLFRGGFNRPVSAVGLMGTSVTGNLFVTGSEEDDEPTLMNLDDESICEVYDCMTALDAGEFDDEDKQQSSGSDRSDTG